MACIYIAPFTRTIGHFTYVCEDKQKRKEKSDNKKQDRNNQQGGAFTETNGLSEEVELEDFFERITVSWATTQKALSPKVCSLLLGMESKPEFEDSSLVSIVYGWRRSVKYSGARAWRDL